MPKAKVPDHPALAKPAGRLGQPIEATEGTPMNNQRAIALTKALSNLESQDDSADGVARTNTLAALARIARRRIPTGSLPGGLVSRIEKLVERNHRAGHRARPDGSLFTLPSWLVVDREAPVAEDPLRVHLHRQSDKGAMTVSTNWSRAQLKTVRLSPRTPAAWRRALILQSSCTIRQGLEEILGAPPDARWIRNMAKTPESVEEEAIGVWSLLLNIADAPRGLVIPGFEATLDDLIVVNRGVEAGRDRRWFADHWPAVVSVQCHGGDVEQDYRRVEKNRKAAIQAATRSVCCQGDENCRKAARFARILPRYDRDTEISRLLAGVDPAIRWLVVNVDEDDSGGLMRRIARKSEHAREQMEYIVSALRALNSRSFQHDKGLYAAGALLSRVLAGSGCDPARLDPTVVGRGLIAVSADCLAAFAAVRRSDGPPTEASSLEAGALALIELLATARPRLTPKQLFRFLEHADSHAVHRVRSAATELPESWPAPAGWAEVQPASDSGDARIVPLLSATAVKAEGKTMSNCLRGGTYMRVPLLTGRKALFSVQVGDDRATLALVATERREASRIQVESYALDALKGPKNGPATPSCEDAARALVERLNRRVPTVLSAAEVQRRQEVLSRLERHSFNANLATARERWEQYVRRLPKRFWSTTPRSVVDGVMGKV